MIIKRESLYISALIGGMITAVSVLLISVNQKQIAARPEATSVVKHFPPTVLLLLLLLGVCVVIISFSLLRIESITIE